MKKYISILLVFTILILSSVIPVRAEATFYFIGDADADGSVTILDATRIQRLLAGLAEADVLENYLSDVDGDKNATILDATCIQRRLAGIENKFYKEKLYTWKTSVTMVGMTVNSDTVQVGTTVGFTVVIPDHEIIDEYEVYVDGILTAERKQHRYFTYTFDREGSYRISIISYDPFGGTAVYTLDMTAVKESESPTVTYAAYNKSTKELTVRASGGVAPYEYQYTIRNNIEPPPPGPTYTVQFTYETDEDGNYYLLCRYCPDSTIFIPTYLLTNTLSYYCDIQVRGADGAVSDIKRVQIILK